MTWYMPVIPAFRKLRVFGASMSPGWPHTVILLPLTPQPFR